MTAVADVDAFRSSPNALFDTTVVAVEQVSPGFRRVTFAGPQLRRFAPSGRDQRIKILVPDESGRYPAALADLREPLAEPHWRSRWRALEPPLRPVLRSYTPVAVRNNVGEIDLDFFAHTPPGPASTWASRAEVGDRVLLSGPDIRSQGDPVYGIQWRPGSAVSVLIAGDETAFPAIRGILDWLGPTVRADVLLEVADAADLARFAHVSDDVRVYRIDRDGEPGGARLHQAVEDWAARHGAKSAAFGAGFYAWMAMESTRVARVRAALIACGVRRDRVHAQGYWHDRPALARAGE